MHRAEREIARIHERYAPLDERVAELLASVRLACERRPGESFNRANERQVEEFIARLKDAFPGATYDTRRPGGTRACGTRPPASGTVRRW